MMRALGIEEQIECKIMKPSEENVVFNNLVSKDVWEVLKADAAKKKANEALYEAVSANDVEKLKAAIAAGADVNESIWGMNALSNAARLGRKLCLQVLIESGADIERRDDRGDTPLVQAIRYWSTPHPKIKTAESSAECAKLLIAAGADVGYYGDYGFALNNHTGRVSYTIPLTKIIESDYDLDVVKLAVDAGADVAPMYGLPPFASRRRMWKIGDR